LANDWGERGTQGDGGARGGVELKTVRRTRAVASWLRVRFATNMKPFRREGRGKGYLQGNNGQFGPEYVAKCRRPNAAVPE